MTFRQETPLRGLSYQELLRRSVTTSPPAQIAYAERSKEHKTSAEESASFHIDSSRLGNSPGCPDNDSAFAFATLQCPVVVHAGPFTHPRNRNPETIPHIPSQKYLFGPPESHVQPDAGLKSSTSFDVTFPFDMVREQAPARDPLQPTMANAVPPSKPQAKEKGPNIINNSVSQQLYPTLQNPPAIEPQFGKPTALGASPQPYSKTQPLTRPIANVSAPRQVSGSHGDKYSNLFVASTKPSYRPELHKPHIVANPLQALRDSQQGPSQPKSTASSRPRHSDDDVFEIPKPVNFPSWQPKPVAPPTFSSQQSTNPYFRPQNVVDLTFDRPTQPAYREPFQQEQYAASDPYMYMDSGKANEDLKALLEGAFEDEEDKPRTRRRKRQQDAKVEELSEKMNNMTVKNEQSTDKDDDAAGEDADDEDDGTVPGLKVKLLPHQIEGVSWMTDKETGTKKTRGVLPKGGILADDMGLGKTIQSIALLLINPKPSAEELAKSKRKLPEGLGKGTLVVAPLALIKQWEGEIKDRVEADHALSVCVHHGPGRTKNYKDLKKYDVVITTYQTLSSEHAGSEGSLKVGCFGIHWYRVILDEAHSIKNRNAKATKAACALNAEYRWCLTGTPMQNNLDELQSLIHFLQIKPYDDLNQWREQITKPMNNGRGGLALRRLQVYLKAFMKRRTKDVLKEQGTGKPGATGKAPGFKIVARTVEKVQAEFTVQEREFYQRLESRTDRSLEMMMAGNKMSYASALVLLMRLRQACNHPKLTGSDLSNETDASNGTQTPSRKKASVEDDMDSIANMLGGLSVETKRCDVCQIELSAKEASNGAIRCAECEADLEEQNLQVKEKRRAKKEKRIKQERQAIRAQRKEARRVIEDSDDEDASAPDEEEEASSVDDDDEYSSDESDSQEPALLQSTKIRHLVSILKADSHQHKYIVFSFFTSMLDLIEPFLKENRIRFARYDGKMRNDAREASLHSLKTDPSTRVLLCSLRAGSLGLNLTAASRVVILEPFWNPFVEEQAIDRVHRLNQTQDVKVYKLTVKGTVEERILDLQEKKRELANATIEGKKGAMKLTLQDMLKLFGRDAESDHPIEVDSLGIGQRSKGLLDSSGSRVAPQSASTSSAGGGHGSGGREREREQVRVSDGTKNPRKEHEIYGRRW
ncbi:adenosinetriphosphatase [Exophiala viscosa]|uniref:Adenosinetriphosphatase n=1 Tax=Exophiala viscosa TaxID=2486360 RepID=A0AAN6DRY4_9EURO|nr:adenosinetriphosphatase [Exophiala viscosa]